MCNQFSSITLPSLPQHFDHLPFHLQPSSLCLHYTLSVRKYNISQLKFKNLAKDIPYIK